MESGLKSISKLFAEKIFRIPDYQRGYSWGDRQLKEFWGDLELMEGGHKHYLGVLTLQSIPERIWSRWKDDIWLINSKNYAPYYVVDGQQRLTTIIILIQCIVEKIKAGEKLNYDEKSDIASKYIHLPKDGRDGSYIFGYQKDNPSYEYLKTKILNRNSSRYSAGEDTIYTKKLHGAKAFFSEKIKNFNTKILSEIYIKITQQLLFNVFHIEDAVDVHVAFETMNNRGLRLSNLELLKNRLIYLTTRISGNIDNVDSARDAINNSWKTVYHQLGRNPKVALNDDYFLGLHFAMYFGKKIIEDHPKLIESTLHHINEADFYKRYLLDQYFTVRRLHSSSKEDQINSTDLYKYAIHIKRTAEQYYLERVMNFAP